MYSSDTGKLVRYSFQDTLSRSPCLSMKISVWCITFGHQSIVTQTKSFEVVLRGCSVSIATLASITLDPVGNSTAVFCEGTCSLPEPAEPCNCSAVCLLQSEESGYNSTFKAGAWWLLVSIRSFLKEPSGGVSLAPALRLPWVRSEVLSAASKLSMRLAVMLTRSAASTKNASALFADAEAMGVANGDPRRLSSLKWSPVVVE
jgi:hypothetical protein